MTGSCVMTRRYPHVTSTRERGAVTVEFALIFPLVALVLGFLIAAGLYELWSGMADYVARDVVRVASMPLSDGTYPQQAALQTRATNDLAGVMGAPTSLALSNDPNVPSAQWGEGDLVTVTVAFHVPGMGGLTGLVNAIPGLGGVDLQGLSTVTRTASVRRE